MIEFLADRLYAASTLAVAFTGIRHRLGGIPFDFGRSLQQVECAPLFVRDLGCRWYQYGEESPWSLAKVTDEIRRLSREVGASRIVCIGNSMGGFGALLFGSLLGADAVIAFSPQTTIIPAKTNSIGDNRWREYQALIETFPAGDLNAMPPARNVTICYGPDDARDEAHVARLTWVADRIASAGGHTAARDLKERGELIPLLQKVIGR